MKSCNRPSATVCAGCKHCGLAKEAPKEELSSASSAAELTRPWSESCECSSWCRAEPQPITDRHHKNCPKYSETIRVVKITHEGASYCDADIKAALASLADGDDYVYQVELTTMLKREYDALPEFTGF